MVDINDLMDPKAFRAHTASLYFKLIKGDVKFKCSLTAQPITAFTMVEQGATGCVCIGHWIRIVTTPVFVAALKQGTKSLIRIFSLGLVRES